MEIYLVRHTKVDVPANICYGQSDVRLTATFEEESKVLQNKITDSKNFIFHTSPLTRCKTLAEKISSSGVKIDPRLMELNFGDWELKTWKEIGKQAFDEWHSDFVNNPVPNGESYLELSKRAVSFWNEIIFKSQNAILVTHGGVIRALLAYVLYIPLEHSFRINIDYGSVSKVIHDKSFIRVEYINS